VATPASPVSQDTAEILAFLATQVSQESLVIQVFPDIPASRVSAVTLEILVFPAIQVIAELVVTQDSAGSLATQEIQAFPDIAEIQASAATVAGLAFLAGQGSVAKMVVVVFRAFMALSMTPPIKLQPAQLQHI